MGQKSGISLRIKLHYILQPLWAKFHNDICQSLLLQMINLFLACDPDASDIFIESLSILDQSKFSQIFGVEKMLPSYVKYLIGRSISLIDISVNFLLWTKLSNFCFDSFDSLQFEQSLLATVSRYCVIMLSGFSLDARDHQALVPGKILRTSFTSLLGHDLTTVSKRGCGSLGFHEVLNKFGHCKLC